MKMRIEAGKPLNLNDQINAINKGLLPTPQARDFRSGSADRIGREGYQNNLNDFVKLWPTPRAGKTTDEDEETWMKRKAAGKVSTPPLTLAVKMWPTPKASEWKGSGPVGSKSHLHDIEKGNLKGFVMENGGGQLNPDWVEALMGYPQGWTDIEKEVETDPRYPAAWIDGTWEEGIPRVTTGSKNRVNRLKCLGNSVVPQIPAYLWMLIKGIFFEYRGNE